MSNGRSKWGIWLNNRGTETMGNYFESDWGQESTKLSSMNIKDKNYERSRNKLGTHRDNN